MSSGYGQRHLTALIEEAIAAGVELEDVVEEIVDPAGLSEDLRDGLWLFAWGCSELPHRIDATQRVVATA